MAEQNVGDVERQLVVFDLAKERYGVDISTVREIIRMQEITHVPDAPDFVEGLINLRSKVIPVVDLRKRFGLEASDETKETRIVVVDIGGESIGVIVDAVSEVMRLEEDTIEKASELITTEHSYYMEGIAKLGDKLLILLDLNRVLSQEEASVVHQITEAAESAADQETKAAAA